MTEGGSSWRVCSSSGGEGLAALAGHALTAQPLPTKTCAAPPSPHLHLCVAHRPRLLLLQAQVVGRCLPASGRRAKEVFRSGVHREAGSRACGRVGALPASGGQEGRAAGLAGCPHQRGAARCGRPCSGMQARLWQHSGGRHSQLALGLVRHRQVLLAPLEALHGSQWAGSAGWEAPRGHSQAGTSARVYLTNCPPGCRHG